MVNNLHIYHANSLVGELSYDNEIDQFRLRYDSAWMKNEFEISPHLLFNIPANSNSIRRYLENIFPEGNGLDILCQSLKLSKQNIKV